MSNSTPTCVKASCQCCDLADDFYDFDERNFALVGRRNNVRYRLGDNVKIRVARANIEKRQLDFAMVDDRGPSKPMSVAETLRDTPRRNKEKRRQRRK